MELTQNNLQAQKRKSLKTWELKIQQSVWLFLPVILLI